ncbi:MAG: hypothetical protein WC533_00755 [Candidatus Pacearchaeota archaeon]
MIIKEVRARVISDTRGDKTIKILLITDFGKFRASAPNGKSRGKYEANPWKTSLERDIKFINSIKPFEIKFDKFGDLINVEKMLRNKIGANTMVAVEYAFLKAIAKQKKKQVWQLINPNACRFPKLIGNAIGGGRHSEGKKPDFQEFWFIPECEIRKSVKVNKCAWRLCKKELNKNDKNFARRLNDENAWQTSLDNDTIIHIMISVKEKLEKKFKCCVKIGVDCAASEFYKNGKYNYQNKKKVLNTNEQINFIKRITERIYIIEDPFQENDFASFSVLKKNSDCLIIGDDLTVTNLTRIKKAQKEKSISAVIIKPNQNGSLIEVKEIIEYCKLNKIKTIISHRSGETSENILSDLAFGFQADYIKTGILGRGRKEKLRRLVKIKKSFC